jgi:hypothetical protein
MHLKRWVLASVVIAYVGCASASDAARSTSFQCPDVASSEAASASSPMTQIVYTGRWITIPARSSLLRHVARKERQGFACATALTVAKLATAGARARGLTTLPCPANTGTHEVICWTRHFPVTTIKRVRYDCVDTYEMELPTPPGPEDASLYRCDSPQAQIYFVVAGEA